MKRYLLAIALCAVSGFTYAEEEMLAPVIVERVDGSRIIVDCAPPNGSEACAGFHQLIRLNFSEREIGMLFGAPSAYPEYQTSYDQVRDRYVALLEDIRENGMPVRVSDNY